MLLSLLVLFLRVALPAGVLVDDVVLSAVFFGVAWLSTRLTYLPATCEPSPTLIGVSFKNNKSL